MSGVFCKKKSYQRAFDDNLCVFHVFIKQIFRVAEKASPSPSQPTVRGVGQLWLFAARSYEFGYGFEAVRIRVKYYITVYILPQNVNQIYTSSDM
jgi:hypothetical protein